MGRPSDTVAASYRCRSEGAGLIEHWNSLLDTQLKHQLRGNPLQGEAPSSRMQGNRSPGCGVSSGRDTGIGTKGLRQQRPKLAITPDDLLGDFVLLVPATLTSAGLD